MKTILKFVVAFAIGIAGGLVIAGVALYFIKGMTLGAYADKLAAFGAWHFVSVFLCATIAAAAAVYAQIILHEGGHLVCGLATGYRFVSFRIFNLTLIRQDGKLKVKKFGIDGTGGQCLLTPPELPLDKIPTVWYNIGGVLSNMVFSLIAVALLLLVDDMPDIFEAFLVMFACIGGVLALMNGIPMNISGISNDGKNACMLKKDPESMRIFVLQLRTNAMVQNGVRAKDMPEEWFRQDGDIDYKNALQVAMRIMYAGWLMDRMQWQEAYDVLEEMEPHKADIVGLFAKELDCELAFCAMVTGRTERAREVLTDKLLNYVKAFSKVMSSKQRLLCAKALYIDNDSARAREIYEAVCARKDDYLMQGEVLSDIAIMETFLSREGV